MDTRKLEADVSKRLKEAGIRIKAQPRLNIFSRQRPDLLFHAGGRSVAIELKASTVGLSDVMHVRRLHVDTVCIVVPSGMRGRIARSVSDYADQMDVKLVDVDEFEVFIASL